MTEVPTGWQDAPHVLPLLSLARAEWDARRTVLAVHWPMSQGNGDGALIQEIETIGWHLALYVACAGADGNPIVSPLFRRPEAYLP